MLLVVGDLNIQAEGPQVNCAMSQLEPTAPTPGIHCEQWVWGRLAEISGDSPSTTPRPQESRRGLTGSSPRSLRGLWRGHFQGVDPGLTLQSCTASTCPTTRQSRSRCRCVAWSRRPNGRSLSSLLATRFSQRCCIAPWSCGTTRSGAVAARIAARVIRGRCRRAAGQVTVVVRRDHRAGDVDAAGSGGEDSPG